MIRDNFKVRRNVQIVKCVVRKGGKNEEEEGKALEKKLPFHFFLISCGGKLRGCPSIDPLERGLRTRANWRIDLPRNLGEVNPTSKRHSSRIRVEVMLARTNPISEMSRKLSRRAHSSVGTWSHIDGGTLPARGNVDFYISIHSACASAIRASWHPCATYWKFSASHSIVRRKNGASRYWKSNDYSFRFFRHYILWRNC